MLPERPFFSVIITLYNKEQYIVRAMQSVLDQTDRDFELLVIDDGSTDGSRVQAERLSDPRIRIVTQANAGEGAARNTGVRQAVGPFLCFLDGDDEWKPGFLSAIRRLITSNPDAGLYATSYEIVETGGQRRVAPLFIPSPAPFSGVLTDYFRSCARGPSPVWSSAVCVPRKTFDAIGWFAEGVSRGCDLDFWGRVAFELPIAFTSEVVSVYRRDAEGRACTTYRLQKPWIFFATARRYLADHPQAPFASDLEDYLAARVRADALECIALGDGPTARVMLAELKRWPDRFRLAWLWPLSVFSPRVLEAVLGAKKTLGG